MFARSGSPLPVEIYDLIYRHLRRTDLARLLRTCHLLFKFTAPYVWCKVDMVRLLALLPGSHVRPRDKAKILQVIPPFILHRYFDRFHIYAQHVEHLSTSPNIGIACDTWTESTRSWVQSYSSNLTMLPQLKVASLSFDEFAVSDQGHREAQFWAQIMIPNNLQALTFRARRQGDMQCFGNLLSRCPSLVRLEFQILLLVGFDPWSSVSEYQAPAALEELDFVSLELNHHQLLWISRMLGLRKLRLALFSSYPETPTEDSPGPSTTKYPVGSFSTLKHLEVRLSAARRAWGEVIQIWQTPLVANLTQVCITTFSGDNVDQINLSSSSTSHMFKLLAACSTKIHQLEIIETVLLDSHPKLRLSAKLLSDLGTLPLRVLSMPRLTTQDSRCNIIETIGHLWPNLEEFYSRNTVVECSHLRGLPTYLPKLRCLHIGLPLRKSSVDSLCDALCHPPSPSSAPGGYLPLAELIVSFYETESAEEVFGYDKKDQDCIARILVALSPNVEIVEGFWYERRPVVNSIRKRVLFYLEARERGQH